MSSGGNYGGATGGAYQNPMMGRQSKIGYQNAFGGQPMQGAYQPWNNTGGGNMGAPGSFGNGPNGFGGGYGQPSQGRIHPDSMFFQGDGGQGPGQGGGITKGPMALGQPMQGGINQSIPDIDFLQGKTGGDFRSGLAARFQQGGGNMGLQRGQMPWERPPGGGFAMGGPGQFGMGPNGFGDVIGPAPGMGARSAQDFGPGGGGSQGLGVGGAVMGYSQNLPGQGMNKPMQMMEKQPYSLGNIGYQPPQRDAMNPYQQGGGMDKPMALGMPGQGQLGQPANSGMHPFQQQQPPAPTFQQSGQQQPSNAMATMTGNVRNPLTGEWSVGPGAEKGGQNIFGPGGGIAGGTAPGEQWRTMQNEYAQQRATQMALPAPFGRYPDGTPISDPNQNFRADANQGRFGGGWGM